MTLLPLILLSPLLVQVAWSDLRSMRIPNALSLATVALFVLAALIATPGDLMGRCVMAGSVFAIGFAAFCLRIVGAGDVKFLAALILFVPVQLLPLFGIVF